jgi:hypothetical protein
MNLKVIYCNSDVHLKRRRTGNAVIIATKLFRFVDDSVKQYYWSHQGKESQRSTYAYCDACYNGLYRKEDFVLLTYKEYLICTVMES